MNRTAFFAILIVLILGIVYVMKHSDEPPQTSMTQTPKEYIQYVERLKAAKQSAQQVEQTLQQSRERTDAAIDRASQGQP